MKAGNECLKLKWVSNTLLFCFLQCFVESAKVWSAFLAISLRIFLSFTSATSLLHCFRSYWLLTVGFFFELLLKKIGSSYRRLKISSLVHSVKQWFLRKCLPTCFSKFVNEFFKFLNSVVSFDCVVEYRTYCWLFDIWPMPITESTIDMLFIGWAS